MFYENGNFIVPSGVTKIKVLCVGGGGGGANGHQSGGASGYVSSGVFSVSPGAVYAVKVGREGLGAVTWPDNTAINSSAVFFFKRQ